MMRDPMAYVEPRIERIPETGCWVWMGSLNKKGYASAKPEKDGSPLVHRWLYQKLFGPVGSLTMDHLCRVRCCINPAHLEPVTGTENTLRGVGPTAINSRRTHCKYGHPFDEANTRYEIPEEKRYRVCKACKRIEQEKIRAKRKSAAPVDSVEEGK